MKSIVGIIGGYGEIGKVISQRLDQSGSCNLRLGGRNLERGLQFCQSELNSQNELLHVDASDEVSLGRFCRNCSVVVNCASAALSVSELIAEMAFNAKAAYVDLSGKDQLHSSLLRQAPDGHNRIAVLAAGLLPGLSGILPLVLAECFDSVISLTVYVGIFDAFTYGGARDYLLGLHDSEAGTSLIDGVPVPRSLKRLTDAEIPFFERRVTAYPYFDSESARVCAQLGAKRSAWYLVLEGSQVANALTRLSTTDRAKYSIPTATRDLMRAAALDVAGRRPYQRMLFEVEGMRDGGVAFRSLVFVSRGGAEISGTMAYLAIDAVLTGAVEPGIHYATRVLSRDLVLNTLKTLPTVATIQTFDMPLSQTESAEVGVI